MTDDDVLATVATVAWSSESVVRITQVGTARGSACDEQQYASKTAENKASTWIMTAPSRGGSGALVLRDAGFAHAQGDAAGAASMSDATRTAIRKSRDSLIADLRTLLSQAKRYFGDVCWCISGEDEIIHGHRAILYARANAAFQTRFLNPNGAARLQAIMSGSTLSLHSPASPRPRTTSAALYADSPGHRPSVSPGAQSVGSATSSPDDDAASSPGLDSPQSRSPIEVSGTESAFFFKSLLDFFYTASTPLGEVFTFLFEDSSYVDKEDAFDRLSQDLLFMWRSKLFADVQIQLSHDFDDVEEDTERSDGIASSEETMFPVHRAILAARCPYFQDILMSPYQDSTSTLYTLPTPPFTSAALHFALAYIYTGSLNLNRSFDLSVSMDIWRCALYLSLDLLRDEVECRMVDMCHGFRGCCKTCRNRSARLYVFATGADVNSTDLRERSQKIVLDHFGEVWAQEIGELPYSQQKALLVQLCSRTTASNAAAAMKGICQLRSRLANEWTAAWADHLRSMLLPLEDRIRHFLKTNLAEMVASKSFIDLIEGIGFSSDVLEKLLALLLESLSEKTAPLAYELLVGKVLLREEGIGMDARARVDDTCKAILAYTKARWISIRAQNGFEPLENWSLKEISDELDQPVSDLLQSESEPMQPTTRTGLRLASTKVHKVESDAFSVVSVPSSLRASILNKNAARKSTVGSSQRLSGFGIDAKDPASSLSQEPSLNRPRVRASSSNTAKSGSNSVLQPAGRGIAVRPRSSVSVAKSADTPPEAEVTIKSSAEGTEVEPATVLAAGKALPEPIEAIVPSSSIGTNKVKKAPLTPVMNKAARLRNLSAASRVSESSSPRQAAARPTSISSARTVGTKTTKTVDAGQKIANNPSTSVGALKQEQASSRPGSAASVRSTRSTKSVASTVASRNKAKASAANATSPVTPSAVPPVPAKSNRHRLSVSSVTSVRSTASRKGTSVAAKKAEIVPPVPKAPTSSMALANARKAATSALVLPKVKEPKFRAPPGSALKVGIPCVVTRGTSKFRATVRYLGEVYFDSGTFVGVEVPVTTDDLPEDLAWNDGSVGDVKYFDLGSRKPATPLEERLAARKARRPSAANNNDGRQTPIQDQSQGPTKGLFVRPNEVLYVF